MSLPSTEIRTDQFVYFASASDFTDQAFGTLHLRFNPSSSDGAGWVYGVYSADGLFSVGLNSAGTGNQRGGFCAAINDFPLEPLSDP